MMLMCCKATGSAACGQATNASNDHIVVTADCVRSAIDAELGSVMLHREARLRIPCQPVTQGLYGHWAS